MGSPTPSVNRQTNSISNSYSILQPLNLSGEASSTISILEWRGQNRVKGIHQRGGGGGEHCGDRISNASGAWRIDALQMNAICLFLGQEYILNDVRDREFLLYFHKKAKKVGLDVAKYNELKDSVARIEADLKRLRDPLRIHSAVASSAGRQPGSSLPTTASLWDKAQFRMSTLLRSAKEPKQWIRRTPQRTLLSHCYLLSTVLFRFHEFDPSNRTWRIETD